MKKEHVAYNICDVISRTSTCNEQRVMYVCQPKEIISNTHFLMW